MQDSTTVLSLGSPSCFPGLQTGLVPPQTRLFNRVALVSMPWGSVRKPALAIPILKRCAQMAGFATQVFPLTIPFAEMVGIDQYERLSDRTLYPEWFFSQYLLGPGGGADMENSWAQLEANPDSSKFRFGVLLSVDNSEALLQKIANEYVPQFLDDCMRTIAWETFGVVGFTTTFAQNFASAALAKRIKERHPHIRIVFGGANVDGEMGVEFLKAFPWVDHVVHGEGEVAFPELLKSLASGKRDKVTSVSTRSGATISRGDGDHPPFVDLNQAPVPDYSDFIYSLQKSTLRGSVSPQISFESSRGCWWGQKHHCTFCGLNLTGMTFRKKEPQRVFDEILELTASAKSLNLCATDNILPLEYLQRLMPKLQEADLDLNLFYETKANLTRAQIQTLANAGVKRIQPGIESFTTRTLAHMQKGITAIQNIQFIKWCRELGVSANYNLLYGFPTDEPADYEFYPKLFRSLQHLQPPSFLTPVVYQRFSPYDFNRSQYGLVLEADDAYRFLYPKQRVSLDHIAYYFQESGKRPVKPAYVDAITVGVERWQKLWQRVTLSYSKGPGYLILHDSRLLEDNDHGDFPASERRHSTIPDPGASIYLFCDQHRSAGAINKMVQEKFNGRYPESIVEAILKRLVDRQVMYEEDGKYLALAVRSSSVATEFVSGG